jgi:3-oxoacyl-ACP reductase-like protein
MAAADGGGKTPPAPAPAAGAAPAAPATPADAKPAPAAAPEGKPAPAPAKEDAKPAPAAAADIELKLPEGAKVDQAVLDGFKSIAKAEGLTSKQAQAIVDFQLKQSAAQMAATNKMIDEALQKERDTHLEQLKTDKDFGGARYDDTVKKALSALKQFGGEEASKDLEARNAQNSPAIVKMLARIRDAIAEDAIAGKQTQDAAPSEADAEAANLRARYPRSPEMWGGSR